MKKIFFYLFIFILLFLSKVHANNNVAFIDIDYLINNSLIGKKIISKIEAEDKKNIQVLKDKETKLKNTENDIKKKQNIISKDELDKEIDALKKNIANFRAEKNKMVKEFTKFKNDEIKKILLQFNEVIKEYMSKNSISIVFDKKNIYIGKSSNDITNDLLKEINNKFK